MVVVRHTQTLVNVIMLDDPLMPASHLLICRQHLAINSQYMQY